MGLGSGEEFAGYRVERELARGGMGVVYVARDIGLDRLVALKVLSAEAAGDEDFRRRFRLESRTAAAIDHPNVVGVHEAREHEGELYIAMQFVPGHDLKTEVRRSGRLRPELAAEVIAQAAEGLDAVHEAGLVHRDVKPANILLHTPDQQVRALITDFGIARAENPETQMTATGLFVGTLDYVSPEQLQGHAIDARSDVYALGCSLFEAVSGSVPFPEADGPAKMFGHVHGPRPALDPELGPRALALQSVIERAMATDPEDRFPSAGDLGRAALAAASGSPPPPPVHERTVATGAAAPAPPPPPPGAGPGPPVPATGDVGPRPETAATVPRVPARPRERSRRGPLLVALAAVLVGALGAAAFLLLGGDEGSPEVQEVTSSDVRWKASTGGSVISTPALAEGAVIVGSDSGSVFAFDAADGGERWRFDTDGEVRSSPVVDRGNAYVGSFDGNLYALDAERGRQRWSAPTGYEVFSSPAVSGSSVVVGAGGVLAFERRSGEQRWSFDTDGPVNSSPAVDAGVVYVGADDGSLHAIDLDDGGSVWSTEIGEPVNSSPLVEGDTVYVGSGRGMFALATDAGRERWSFELPGGVNSSPITAEGRIVFGARDGAIYALDVESGERAWSFETGDAVDSSPVLADGVVYVGSNDGGVYGLDASSGEERWHFDAGAPVVAAPALDGDTIYIASDDGSVLALPAYDG